MVVVDVHIVVVVQVVAVAGDVVGRRSGEDVGIEQVARVAVELILATHLRMVP